MSESASEGSDIELKVSSILPMLREDASESARRLGREMLDSLGPQAVPALIHALPDYGAIDGLRVFSDAAIYSLLDLSSSPEASPEDQMNASLAFVVFVRDERDARAFYEVRRLASQGAADVVRAGAQYSMERFGAWLRADTEHLSDFVEKLRTDNPRKLRKVVEQLVWMSGHDPTPRRVISMLLHKAPQESLTSGIAMTMLAIGQPAVEPTIAALDAGVPGVAWPLVLLGTTFSRAREAVMEAAESHADAAIRAEAVQALVLMGTTQGPS